MLTAKMTLETLPAESRTVLEWLFDSVRIERLGGLSFSGAALSQADCPETEQFTTRPSPSSSEISAIVTKLRNEIYSRYFCRPNHVDRLAAANPHPLDRPFDASDLVAALSAANKGQDTWHAGWRVEQVESGGVVVLSRGSMARRVAPGDYALTFTERLRPRPGCAAMLLQRRESLTIQSGVYYALGESVGEPSDEGATLRIYFNASGFRALPVFGLLTHGLNELKVPFTLKTMLRPQDQDRCDATLLYVPRGRYPALASLIRRSPGAFAELGPETPLLTKVLAPGIGLAESPRGSAIAESFGMHRSRLLAESIIAAWMEGLQDGTSRFEAARKRFAEEGISWSHPYLNPGSEDCYEL